MRAPSSSAPTAPETYASPVRTVVSPSMGARLWTARQGQKGIRAVVENLESPSAGDTSPGPSAALSALRQARRPRGRPACGADAHALVQARGSALPQGRSGYASVRRAGRRGEDRAPGRVRSRGARLDHANRRLLRRARPVRREPAVGIGDRARGHPGRAPRPRRLPGVPRGPPRRGPCGARCAGKDHPPAVRSRRGPDLPGRAEPGREVPPRPGTGQRDREARAHPHAGRARGLHRRVPGFGEPRARRSRAARDHRDPAPPHRHRRPGAAREGDPGLVARKRPLVLVVEDDPALGDVIITALRDDGLDSKLASDGDEAMRLVDSLEPSCMVLDLMMPRRDGFSVLRELRSDGRIARMPVVVVTAMFGLSERNYATELGAADYVTKPFELDDLVGRVRALITPTPV